MPKKKIEEKQDAKSVKKSNAVKHHAEVKEVLEKKETKKSSEASVKKEIKAPKKTSKATSEKKEKVIKSKPVNNITEKGKRKCALAVARAIELADKKEGVAILVNKVDYKQYFSKISDQKKIIQPILATQTLVEKPLSYSVKVYGGGFNGQSDAVRLAISKVIAKNNPEEVRVLLRKEGFLTTDDRQVQQKTTGKPKARKSKQWSKR